MCNATIPTFGGVFSVYQILFKWIAFGVLPMYAQHCGRNNKNVPKVIKKSHISNTKISLDFYDSDDEPESAAAASSAKNSCNVEKDEDSSIPNWCISPEDNEGFNSLCST